MNKQEIILEKETILLDAMKSGNIIKLDQLIHKDLIFNLPNGQTITKELDLENYRSGLFKINKILTEDRVINIFDNVAVVIVTLILDANFNGQEINNKFRYLRVWKEFGGNWQIIAGSSCSIN